MFDTMQHLENDPELRAYVLDLLARVLMFSCVGAAILMAARVYALLH